MMDGMGGNDFGDLFTKQLDRSSPSFFPFPPSSFSRGARIARSHTEPRQKDRARAFLSPFSLSRSPVLILPFFSFVLTLSFSL